MLLNDSGYQLYMFFSGATLIGPLFFILYSTLVIYVNDTWWEKWIEALYDGGQAQNTTVQRLTSGKDCPATQHLYSGICEDNADGKAHPSADNPNRSSGLDCASNEFSCKSEGLIK